MKRNLLFTVLLLGIAFAQAQNKATATVNLMTGMTAKLELNNATTTATLTLTGPSDRYIALQIGSFATGGGMQDGADVVYWNGTTLVDANHAGIGNTPNIDAVNDWTVTSNTISGTTRTIIATRAFDTDSTDDYTIVYSDPSIDFAYARSSIASNVITSGHGTNRGYSLNNAFTCVAPAAPTAPSSQTFCAGATVANLDATGDAGAIIKWYANSTGGTALASTTVLVNGTTYYASQTVGDCESVGREAIVATVTTVPLPGTTDTTPEFCSNATIADLTVTGQPGATFNWYSQPANGTALPNTTELAAGSYYVSQTVGTCTSARLQITVSFFTIPQPTASEEQSFCSESTVADLDATGQVGAIINWYDSSEGGTPLAGTTVLVAGDYYVSQTVGTCISERKHVVVSYVTLDGPDVPDETPTVCPGTTISDLTVTGLPDAVFKWYADETAEEPLAGTTELVTGESYFVAQTVGDCVSNRREVTITIDTLPVPDAEDQTLCQGSTVADLEAEGLGGAVFTWHKTQDGPTLNENEVITAGSYFVEQTVNGCTSELKEIVVALLPSPAAPGGAPVQQFEEGETVSDFTISVAVGATIQWYVMDGDNMEPIDSTTELTDNTEYYVTQTVDGCESEPLKITADEVLGTSSFDIKNLAVYPNPFIDMLTVSNKEIISEVAIINLLGQTVISQKVNSEKVEINTARLQSGTYILKVTTPKGSASLKIVK